MAKIKYYTYLYNYTFYSKFNIRLKVLILLGLQFFFSVIFYTILFDRYCEKSILQLHLHYTIYSIINNQLNKKYRNEFI